MRTRRLLIFLAILCLLSAVAGGVTYFLSIRNLVVQEKRLQAEAACELILDDIDLTVEYRRMAVHALAGFPALAAYLENPSDDELQHVNTILESFGRSFNRSTCYLLDANGTVVAASNSDTTTESNGATLSAGPIFRAAMQGGTAVALTTGEKWQGRKLVLSCPVAVAGSPVGAAVIAFPAEVIEHGLKKMTGTAVLLDPAGTVFASTRADWLQKVLLPGTKQAAQRSILSRARVTDILGLAGHTGGFSLLNTADGERSLAVIRPVPAFSGWQLVYLYDINHIGGEILAGIFNPTGYAFSGLVVLILLAAYALVHLAGREIAARAATEKKAAQSHAVLNQIFNASADAIRIIDRNFTMVLVNKTFADMVGLPLTEIKGKKCWEVFPGQHCNTPACPKSRIMDDGQPRVTHEARKKSPEGKEMTCLVAAVPFKNDQGRTTGTLESIRDISDRIKSENALERAFEDAHRLAEEVAASHELVKTQKIELETAYKKLKETQSHILQQEKMASIGQLAAGVAHEINNPMGFIASNLSTLARYMERFQEYTSAQQEQLAASGDGQELTALADLRKKLKIDYIADDVKDLIKESLDGADRVRKIVQGLKSFSRLDQAEIQAADINECLESTINIVWNELKYKADVTKEYGELPATVCNPLQLNQVFMNLLVNAAHAIEKQGTISVKTWSDAKWIYIAIGDSGCGIPPEQVRRIFEPFFTTKDVGKGTGLGLSIAYDIVVKKHKGNIEVQSEVGKGSTFTIRIPVVAKKDADSGQ